MFAVLSPSKAVSEILLLLFFYLNYFSVLATLVGISSSFLLFWLLPTSEPLRPHMLLCKINRGQHLFLDDMHDGTLPFVCQGIRIIWVIGVRSTYPFVLAIIPGGVTALCGKTQACIALLNTSHRLLVIPEANALVLARCRREACACLLQCRAHLGAAGCPIDAVLRIGVVLVLYLKSKVTALLAGHRILKP